MLDDSASGTPVTSGLTQDLDQGNAVPQDKMPMSLQVKLCQLCLDLGGDKCEAITADRFVERTTHYRGVREYMNFI